MTEGSNNNTRKIKLHERVAIVETKVDSLIENHIPHLTAKVDRITWLIIVTLIGVVVDLIFRFVLV